MGDEACGPGPPSGDCKTGNTHFGVEEGRQAEQNAAGVAALPCTSRADTSVAFAPVSVLRVKSSGLPSAEGAGRGRAAGLPPASGPWFWGWWSRSGPIAGNP